MKAAKYLMNVPTEVLNKTISLENYLIDYLGLDSIDFRIWHEKYINDMTLIAIVRFVENNQLAVYFIIDPSIASEFVDNVNNARSALNSITTPCVLLDLTESQVEDLLTSPDEYSKNFLFPF